MKMKTILLVIALGLVHALDEGLENPSIFERGGHEHCEENGVVNSWCSKSTNPALECVLLPDFDQYGCSCHGDAASCPSECVVGQPADQKTHYGIQCLGIPEDEPNYVLKESHELLHCEENAVVAGWCDDYMEESLECNIFPDTDEYMCRCEGNAAACPLECIGGGTPLSKSKFAVRCSSIPVDQPNYIIKGELKK